MQRNPLSGNRAVFDAFLGVVNKSKLEPKIKNDVQKNIECLKYIKANYKLISNAVDNKRNAQYFNNSYRDQKNGVLRDTHQTSFHINGYNKGADAVKSLTALNEQCENVLQNLSSTDLILFAKKMRYDRASGCLDARLGPALEWASKRLVGAPPEFEDMMDEYTDLHDDESENAGTNLSIEEYISQNCLGKKALIKKDKNTTEEVIVTQAMIYDYLVGFGYVEERDEKSEVEEKYVSPLDIIKNENGLIKVMTSHWNDNQHWTFLLRQINDPVNVRPVRQLHVDRTQIFNPATGKIETRIIQGNRGGKERGNPDGVDANNPDLYRQR